MEKGDKIDVVLIIIALGLLVLTLPFMMWPDPRVVPIIPSPLWGISHFVTIIVGSFPFGLMFWILLTAEYIYLTKNLTE